MASAAKKRKSNASTGKTEPTFVVCLSSRSFAASLEARKLYRTFPDVPAQKLRLLRVVDESGESGESYLYPAARFGHLALPPRLARALSR